MIQLSDLQNILSGIGAGGATGGGGGGAPEAVDLSTAITPEAMIPILANKDVQAKLIPHLPKGESLPQSEEELRATVNQPQFQQVGTRVGLRVGGWGLVLSCQCVLGRWKGGSGHGRLLCAGPQTSSVCVWAGCVCVCPENRQPAPVGFSRAVRSRGIVVSSH